MIHRRCAERRVTRAEDERRALRMAAGAGFAGTVLEHEEKPARVRGITIAGGGDDGVRRPAHQVNPQPLSLGGARVQRATRGSRV